MKLMIDIPKRVYDYIFKKDAIVNSDRFEVTESIINGTKPKTGHWIVMDEGFSPYECSECGTAKFKKSKYCPDCGVKMIEP